MAAVINKSKSSKNLQITADKETTSIVLKVH